MPSPIRAFLDANVLYAAPLRDLLFELSLRGALVPLTSVAVLDECFRALRRERPDLSPTRLDRTRRLMLDIIGSGVFDIRADTVPQLELPDSGDLHVLAAAIRARADLLLTWNTRDFPAATAARYGITVIDPDAFLLGVVSGDAATAEAAVAGILARLAAPPMTRDAYLSVLARCGLVATATALRRRP